MKKRVPTLPTLPIQTFSYIEPPKTALLAKGGYIEIKVLVKVDRDRVCTALFLP